jgi:Family of unknown function (DUF5691)
VTAVEQTPSDAGPGGGGGVGGRATSMAEDVATALVGTLRRAVGTAGPASEEAAARLLGHAAMLTVAARAGRLAGTAEPIAPAPPEDAPVVAAGAARRLAEILRGERIRMLPEWLAAAGDRGRLVPPALLPELLDRGRSDRSLRPLIVGTAGRRGMWLAMQNADWAYLVIDTDDTWETGTKAARLTHLSRLRAEDPERARETLNTTWRTESAPDRAAFVQVLENGLSAADEPFLEAALDDRAKDVRQLAADLLSLLPSSAYGRRMAERARGCVRRTGTTLSVEPPAECDAGMRRDGIPDNPAAGGQRATWLGELLSRAPLATWTTHLRATAEQAVRYPVDDDYAAAVHTGWARAAVLQRDLGWAGALLDHGALSVELRGDLLSVYDQRDRPARAAALLSGLAGDQDRLTVLTRIPGPWTGALAGAVIELLTATTPAGTGATGTGATDHKPWIVSQLCRLAADRLSTDAVARLDTVVGGDAAWPLVELAATLRFRHEMLEELS